MNEESIFDETFHGMFELKGETTHQIVMDNPPPPVPLDSGVLVLILLGIIISYFQFSKKLNQENW